MKYNVLEEKNIAVEAKKEAWNGQIDDFFPIYMTLTSLRLYICCQRTQKVDYIMLLSMKHHMRCEGNIDNFKHWPKRDT